MFQSPVVFLKAMVQGLGNVGAGAFSTWDAVHHSFPVVCWYWVLGLCPIVMLILSPPPPFHFVLFRLCYVFS